ncbi:MAG: hypothetical protein CVV27_18225 [Candidatus Melainabacteria bacterium HGW-Melainabacteria-1]|nr:MAG: hypothetical protein CVV27_18225 [Candidatus Melainabacteria bacterium HGW-Melainabacteria-1]
MSKAHSRLWFTALISLSACSTVPQHTQISLSQPPELTQTSLKARSDSQPKPESEIKSAPSPVTIRISKPAIISGAGQAVNVTAAVPDQHPVDQPEPPCQVDLSGGRQLLPQTTVPPLSRIEPPTDNDCGFYNWAWHSFLFSTRPDASGQPAFWGAESLESVFGLSHSQDDSELPLLNAGFRQAGDLAAILVDQNRRPVFYSIHINRIFADFVRSHKLNQVDALLRSEADGGIATDLEFPPGSVEFKAAWRIVEAGEDTSDYLTLRARVPLLRNQGGKVVASDKNREVTVALLSLHVVGVVVDHPEFIWATFEHADSRGKLDLGPAALANPVMGQTAQLEALAPAYPLFEPGSPVALANRPLDQLIDEASQTFPAPTPVYRAFPGSLREQSEADSGVDTLNQAIGELFAKTDPQAKDWRRHYLLVGAVWINQPGADRPDGDFGADRHFENTPGHSVLAGEDALSSLAMESFTQDSSNCFSCHNTRAKILSSGQTLPPRRINISNTLTFFAQAALGRSK